MNDEGMVGCLGVIGFLLLVLAIKLGTMPWG